MNSRDSSAAETARCYVAVSGFAVFARVVLALAVFAILTLEGIDIHGRSATCLCRLLDVKARVDFGFE